ncbi:glycerol-3-phosphate acyl transferase [Angomonas deanei]|nr:glycerol-3-phosphate acyl transferase [Angomonas deanei]|eukprot:EPY25892.1 glycerol-3-phosphate acyl transferase [Angomonas deanei]
MWILKRIYFREVTVVGAENIPMEGAVVFYGNHQNQFIDALMMNSSVGRPVRFIMAEKSYRQPVIGWFGKMFNAVPVVRPQDVPLVDGKGMLCDGQEITLKGRGTEFTSLSKGDVITWFKGTLKCTAQVHRICSDEELEVTMPIQAEFIITEPTAFKLSKRIDHSEMYAQVYDTLQNQHCIGIFPEGGSHDRTSLLPLKAGVALFSLGAAERNISVKIVPCGLTYLYGSKFRSRAYVEFGKPTPPPPELVQLFNTDKRQATGIFLEQLNGALRDVTINVADYKTLKFLHTFRQLYQPPKCVLSAGDYLRLTRRLSVMVETQKDNPEFADFRSRVESYSDYCNALFVRDSQTVTLKQLGKEVPEKRLLLRRGFTIYMMLVVLVPFFIVALPVGLLISYYTSKKTRKALSESKVKIVGADVRSSFNVTGGVFFLPPYLLLITLIVYLFTDGNTALIVLFCLPMAMYVSLLILQEVIMELRAALPLFISIVTQHKQFKKLYEKRQALVEVARSMVSQFDPQLEKEMGAYSSVYEMHDDVEREPSLFSLRYNVRRRQVTNS